MATLLPLAVSQFLDQNGVPLAGGSVYFYIPNTTTPKDTYQDADGTVLNTNPVVLDSSGEAIIYGTGSYRQVVTDAGGNTIWDQVTADTAIGGLAWGGTSTGTPNAQVIAASSFSQQDGQQVSFIVGAGLTNTNATTVAPGGGSGISILKDSASGPTSLIGGELVAGNVVTIIYDAGRGAFHLVQNTNYALLGRMYECSYTTPDPGHMMCDGSAISRTAYAPLFAKIGTTWGTGDGSTTFNIPDKRGYFSRGWDDGAGIDPGRAFASTQTDAFKSHTHTATVNDGGHAHNVNAVNSVGAGTSGAIGSVNPSIGTIPTSSATTGITVTNASTGSTETRPVNVAVMYEIYVGFPTS
jgi:microcystin-dependent protein